MRKCGAIFKTGKRVGRKCGRKCYEFTCRKHNQDPKILSDPKIWSDLKMRRCGVILKAGKRVGRKCGRKCYEFACRKHNHLDPKIWSDLRKTLKALIIARIGDDKIIRNWVNYNMYFFFKNGSRMKHFQETILDDHTIFFVLNNWRFFSGKNMKFDHMLWDGKLSECIIKTWTLDYSWLGWEINESLTKEGLVDVIPAYLYNNAHGDIFFRILQFKDETTLIMRFDIYAGFGDMNVSFLCLLGKNPRRQFTPHTETFQQSLKDICIIMQDSKLVKELGYNPFDYSSYGSLMNGHKLY